MGEHGTASAPVTEAAPAKINLTLRVTGRRADGYHRLDSLVAFTDIGDTVTLTRTDRPGVRLAVDGPLARGIPTGPDNLVVRAAEVFRTAARQPLGVDLALIKRLPAAAGIGGGSSDAAATLRGMQRLFGDGRPDPGALTALAAGLGADVPVCLSPRTWCMRGIGEVLVPGPILTGTAIVLVNPRVPVATPAVFKARSAPFSQAFDLPAGPLPPHALADLIRKGGNDLQTPAVAVAPVVAEVLAILNGVPEALVATMSGSGATCVAVCPTAAEAGRLARRLHTERPGWWTSPATLL